MKTLTISFLSAVMLFLNTTANATTQSAVANGNWEQGSTWSGGVVPGCGDSIVIGSAYTVTVTTVIDHTPCNAPIIINVSGLLTFQTGKKLRLPCSSIVYINTGGQISAGGGGGNSNLIDICEVTVWNTAMGTLDGPDTLQVIPLPVELLTFSATPYLEEVKLNWVTASERNNKCFIIEKSRDGKEFDEFTRVEGAGNSHNLNSYQVIDKNPFYGLAYYRLSQMDFDGSVTMHNTVAIDMNRQTSFALFPNPTSGELFANIDSRLSGAEGLLIINKSDGQHLLSKEIKASTTYGIRLLDREEELRPGGYLVTLNFRDQSYTQYIISK